MGEFLDAKQNFFRLILALLLTKFKFYLALWLLDNPQNDKHILNNGIINICHKLYLTLHSLFLNTWYNFEKIKFILINNLCFIYNYVQIQCFREKACSIWKQKNNLIKASSNWFHCLIDQGCWVKDKTWEITSLAENSWQLGIIVIR